MTSSNSQTSKSKWGVGSFFQQAVAGVESRLDTILAEEDAPTSKPASVKGSQAEQPAQQSGMSVADRQHQAGSRPPLL
jgi:hypothetical protein